MKKNTLYETFHSNVQEQTELISLNNFTYKIVLPVINKYVKTKQHILDIGCGVGTLSFYMAKKGNKVLGIDISKTAIETATQSAKNLGLTDISFEASSFPEGKVKGSFDVIVCSEVLEHLEKDDLALQHMYSLLKPRGIVILSVPSKNAPMYKLGQADEFDKRVGHVRRYTLEELTQKCKKAGFTVLETKKTEGVLRNFLFLNPIAGKSIRFIKFFLVDIVSWLDIISLALFGESQLFVILTK